MLSLAGWYGPGIGVLKASPVQLKSPESPISLIVAVHNEERYLPDFIDAISEQRDIDFEIVIVLNGCTDNSLAICEFWRQKNSRVKIIELTEANKKLAITKGIQLATNDLLVFTDVDCRPASPFWLREMAAALQKNAGIIIGYSPIIFDRSLIGFFSKSENFLTGIQYLGAAAWQRPYMAVGRNMAYTRQVFFGVGGFKSHQKIASGDDDLFVQSAVRQGIGCQIQWNPEAFVNTFPPENFKYYIHRKSRHFTASFHYPSLTLLGLSATYAGRLWMWISPIFLLWAGFPLWRSVFFLLCYLGLSYLIWKPLSTKLCEKDILKHLWWSDLCITFAWLIAGFTSLFRNRKRWI